MFDTERLVLRPFCESDLEDILGLWNEPLVQRGFALDNVVPRSPKFAEQVRAMGQYISNQNTYQSWVHISSESRHQAAPYTS
jgi:RimJ/RimL family protein N-acetyltransferase